MTDKPEENKGLKKVIIDIPIYNIVRIIALLIFIYLIYYVRDVLILIILAFVLATFLEPIVDRFEKRGAPRFLSILTLYAIIIAFFVFLVRAILPPVVSQIQQIATNSDYYIGIIRSYLMKVPYVGPNEINRLFSNIMSALGTITPSGILSGVTGVFSSIAGAIVVLVMAFYFLLRKGGIELGIAYYFPTRHSEKAVRVFRKISEKVSLWLRGQIFLSLVVATLVLIGLAILGVPFALTIATFTAIAEFVPIFGPFLAGTLATLIALTVSPGKAIAVIILFTIITQLESNVLSPNILKRAVGLTPAIIIISILLGGKLLGLIGIILAVPIASTISVILDEYYLNKGEKKEV
ncbi:MAG: AI-2E family transporter [Patescibacteria group bacterium]|nr:AI-2E family transporter [Patescibacteria group bacterium]